MFPTLCGLRVPRTTSSQAAEGTPRAREGRPFPRPSAGPKETVPRPLSGSTLPVPGACPASWSPPAWRDPQTHRVLHPNLCLTRQEPKDVAGSRRAELLKLYLQSPSKRSCSRSKRFTSQRQVQDTTCPLQGHHRFTQQMPLEHDLGGNAPPRGDASGLPRPRLGPLLQPADTRAGVPF